MAALAGEASGVEADVCGLCVLHVVRKFSSGVGTAIAQYTRSLPEVDHHLLSGTPVDEEGDLADQARFASVQQMTGRTRSMGNRVREVVRALRPDVVHAHSSHGGAYARLAVRAGRPRLVYTPHCYAFERRDVSVPGRAAFWLAEALLAQNTSAIAACSLRELQLSRRLPGRRRAVLVPNVAPDARCRPATRLPARPPLVAGGGRLSPQKDPSFFLACVHRLRQARPELRAVWLGDGDPAERTALQAGGVTVTGWLPRAGTLTVLGDADLYLHSARWEGFPMMVAEAAGLGVPTVVRRLPCFADVPAILTIERHDDLQHALDCLSHVAAASANAAAWAGLLGRHTVADQRAALLDAYALGQAAVGRRSR